MVKSPTDNSHAYQLRFLNGVEATLRRHEFSIRKQFQKDGLQEAGAQLAEFNLYDHVIYRCIVGSKAYGLDDTSSDIDRRGIYLPPAQMHWSLYGVPEQLDNKETEECYWEIQKFLILALKANPNVLECLYTPLVETANQLAEELLAMRSIFLSQLVYQTYKERPHRVKPLLYVYRVLSTGIHLMRTGELEANLVQLNEVFKLPYILDLIARKLAGPEKSILEDADVAFHQGEYERLRGQLEEAYQASTLPETPSAKVALNELLVRLRMVSVVT